MSVDKWMFFLWALSIIDGYVCIFPDDAEFIRDDHNDNFDLRQSENYPRPYVYLPPETNSVYSEDKERNREHDRKCTDKMERALETVRRRQITREGMLNFNGFSLHQPLRSAPFDLYVTDMRVRLPSSKSWVRVDRCNFNSINHTLDTRLRFNDLTISGRVNLFNDDKLQREPISPNPEASCNMILRLRKAGIGFHTEPIRHERGQLNVKTDSYFLEPGFISVYAYGCEPGLNRRDNFKDSREYAKIEDEEEEISREMEDIFLKGIRSLLTSYMQKELQPAIKETLMKNMGYTLSYG